MAWQSTANRCKSLRCRLFFCLLAALVIAMPARAALDHHFIYFPETRQAATPASAGLTYEALRFAATDGTALTGWLVPGQTGAPVVLFCMGNAGNISHRLETLRLLHELGVSVFIFNYRGYGESAGTPSEAGTYADIAGARQLLASRGWPASRTIIFGRSLGAAVGLEGALHDPPAGLIMESAFTSIAAMGRHHYPLLKLLFGWLVGARYDNLTKIARLQSPLLLIHGQRDSICPPAMAEELFARATGEKQLIWLPAADHNDGFIVGGEFYRQSLRACIARWTGFTRED